MGRVCIYSPDPVRRLILQRACGLRGIRAVARDTVSDLQRSVGRTAPAIVVVDAKTDSRYCRQLLKHLATVWPATVRIVLAEPNDCTPLRRVAAAHDCLVCDPFDPEFITDCIQGMVQDVAKKKHCSTAAWPAATRWSGVSGMQPCAVWGSASPWRSDWWQGTSPGVTPPCPTSRP